MKIHNEKDFIAQLGSVPALPDEIFASVIHGSHLKIFRRRLLAAAAALVFAAGLFGTFEIHSELTTVASASSKEYKAASEQLSSAGQLFASDESDDDDFMTIASDSYNQ